MHDITHSRHVRDMPAGDPSNELEGSGADAKKNGYVEGGKVRKIPLEVMVRGDKDPIYSATFDDDGRGGYAAAMPFNSYGALGMARDMRTAGPTCTLALLAAEGRSLVLVGR